eukprot:CAMPEP_0201731634 /NCGR_PEP_ID=MMETSP0593-20130828/26341_1 /ASSEMBLY_ACC=CAM_ASM_000672 /TAXON_ID=267983 /ORGANISM="Skeletonema japonicum, Strain CCMP2506" /LENGTH=508 /DNA_ID=CAMNT_0048224441 /DNA_START=147 /DNA_END=1673 /DNA_ORIENTATION=-
MDTTTARDRPPAARLSSSSLSRQSRNGRRAPQDNRSNSLRSSQHSRRQSKRSSRSDSDTSTRSRAAGRSTNGRDNNNKKQPESRSNFSKWVVTIVMFLAIADLVVLWTSVDLTIGDQNGDQPHQVGPEVGIHQFTEKRTTDIHIQLMRDIARKQQEEAKKQRPKKDIRRIEEQRRRQYVPIDKVKNVAKANKVKNEHTFGVDEHIVNILTAANIQLDAELASQLPSWYDIVSMYGDKPIIHGLETCKTYRDTVVPADRMLGPAGIFNTGTNLLFELMKGNCIILEASTSKTHREPKRNGIRFQPPWGKHNPPSFHRGQHVAKFWGEGINQTAFFPVVMIKDFYHWAGSQCRHSYTSFWEHDEKHCPKLVDSLNHPNQALVKYGKGIIYYDSILDLWNRYYQEWEGQTFPHLTTRYEDLLFHGEEVTRTACDCVGGIFTTNFRYVEGSAKENGLPIHNGANGLKKALLQYGNSANRLTGFTDRDRVYASKAIDPNLVDRYGYKAPPLPT